MTQKKMYQDIILHLIIFNFQTHFLAGNNQNGITIGTLVAKKLFMVEEEEKPGIQIGLGI